MPERDSSSVPSAAIPAALNQEPYHNVAGLTEENEINARLSRMKCLFKDEVPPTRGLKLVCQGNCVCASRFPGNGLAVAHSSAKWTPERCTILRNADAIVVEEMQVERALLQNLAELRGVVCPCQRGRDGRMTDL